MTSAAVWGRRAELLQNRGGVNIAFFNTDEDVALARSTVLLGSCGPESVIAGTPPPSLMYNGVMSHASAFHGPHRAIAFDLYRDVIQVLFAHCERDEYRPRMMQMLPFQVHYREGNGRSLCRWGFSDTPGLLAGDDVYLAFMNLNPYDMYMEVAVGTHNEVQAWRGTEKITDLGPEIDPLVAHALGHMSYLPFNMNGTLDQTKAETIVLQPGCVYVYKSNLVVMEPRVATDLRHERSVCLTFAYRLTHSAEPLHPDAAIDLKLQRPPMLHTGKRASMYPPCDPFSRPGIYRDTFGSLAHPKGFRRRFLVEWPAVDGKTVCMPQRIGEGLVEAGSPYTNYTDEEASLLQPGCLPLITAWEEDFWSIDADTIDPMPRIPSVSYPANSAVPT